MVYLDGRKARKDTFAATKGEVRRKAKRKFEEELRTGGSVWRLSDPFSRYIDEVSRPALAKAKLEDGTQERYATALRHLLGECKKCKQAGKRHEFGLNRHTLGSGMRPRALEDLFTEIAEHHGIAATKSCRTVWNKYVAKRLIFDGLMDANPVMGQRLSDLTGVQTPPRKRGGKALARKDYNRALQWLLNVDPSDWLISHKKGGWIWRPEVQLAAFYSGIDITLLQMTTGLRQSEARQVDWSMAHVSDEGVMSIDVPKTVAKSGHPRIVLVLDQRVATRLLRRRDEQMGKGLIVGAPMDTGKVWNRMRCGEVCRKLYVRMAEATRIELFEVERSHMWRTTLRAFYVGKVPEAVLNSQFGHSTEVANLYYTDASDLQGLASAAKLGPS